MALLTTLTPLLAITIAAAGEAPPKVPRLAVLAVRAEQGVPQGSANLLLELVTSDVQRSGKFEVINAADVAATLGFERQKQLLGCSEESCMAEISAAMGVDYLLDTSVGVIGNLRVLALKLIDARSSKSVRRETETVPDDSALVDAAHRLVAKVFDLNTGPRLSGKRIAGIALVAGGVVLTGVGVALGLVANGQLATYRTSASPSDASSARLSANLADSSYGVALAAGIVGLILIIIGGGTGAGS